MMTVMDRVETRCYLDWWANSVTLLGSVDVSLVITSTETGWHAHGQLTNDEAIRQRSAGTHRSTISWD